MARWPFTPEILDALPERVAELYRGLEDTLLKEICSRLKISGQANEVTVQMIRALRSHGIDLKEIERAIAKTASLSDETLQNIFDDVVAQNQQYYSYLVSLSEITEPERYVDKEKIDAIYEQTKGELRNLAQSMGFVMEKNGGRVMLSAQKAFQECLDMAIIKVESGAFDYDRAIQDAVKNLASGGLCVAKNAGQIRKNVVEYESGRIDHLDVAVRRAVMTGVNQLNAKYREKSMEYLETDLVEVTAHLGARNVGVGYENHENWQGRIYRWKKYPQTSKGVYPDFEEYCGLGQVTGILGVNCRHNYHAFLEGVMEPTYTAQDLENLRGDHHVIKFEGKTYDGFTSTQKQRRLERSIRKWKRVRLAYEASGQVEKAKLALARTRRLVDEYKKFSKVAGLTEKWKRMEVTYP